MNLEEFKLLYPTLDILDIQDTKDTITITSKNKMTDDNCPYCGVKSNKIHQKYIKYIQDLPINNKDVTIKLLSRIYRCDNTDCNHFSFNEQFEFVKPLEKKTKRLIDYILKLSKDNTCRSVAKILNDEGAIISKATVNNIYNKYKKVE
jgi:transposase